MLNTADATCSRKRKHATLEIAITSGVSCKGPPKLSRTPITVPGMPFRSRRNCREGIPGRESCWCAANGRHKTSMWFRRRGVAARVAALLQFLARVSANSPGSSGLSSISSSAGSSDCQCCTKPLAGIWARLGTTATALSEAVIASIQAEDSPITPAIPQVEILSCRKSCKHKKLGT